MRRRGSLAWSWGLLRTGVISWMILGGIGRLRCILNRRRRRLIRCWKRFGIAVSVSMGFWLWEIDRRVRRLTWVGGWGGLSTNRRRGGLARANFGVWWCFRSVVACGPRFPPD